jgi:hypothetical protein
MHKRHETSGDVQNSDANSQTRPPQPQQPRSPARFKRTQSPDTGLRSDGTYRAVTPRQKAPQRAYRVRGTDSPPPYTAPPNLRPRLTEIDLEKANSPRGILMRKKGSLLDIVEFDCGKKKSARNCCRFRGRHGCCCCSVAAEELRHHTHTHTHRPPYHKSLSPADGSPHCARPGRHLRVTGRSGLVAGHCLDHGAASHHIPNKPSAGNAHHSHHISITSPPHRNHAPCSHHNTLQLRTVCWQRAKQLLVCA